MSDSPRFLLEKALIQHLATVDTSYGECAVTCRLALYVDYHRGVPQSVQMVRIGSGTLFKIHTESA